MTCKLSAAEAIELAVLTSAFNNAHDDLRYWLRKHVDEWQDEFDAKGERWQESEAGKAAQERLDALEIMAEDIENYDPDLSPLD